MRGADGEKKGSKTPIRTVLQEDCLLAQVTPETEALVSKGYGRKEGNEVKFTFYEGLYLLTRGIIEVWDRERKRTVDFQELLLHSRRADEDSWVKYLIYRDLRSRGYVVREGFGLGIDFRVYERGKYGKDTADHLIYGIKEGRPVRIQELAQTLSYAQNLKKKLILAVLNRRGEVVYYSLSRLTFKELGESMNFLSEG
ncbi:tRNA-intron lyase [Candidatus Bathyarchaeota archaeon]|nr:MAG: tRNA-intron lyase [Candidatus Bathyarchaeota archaeon]